MKKISGRVVTCLSNRFIVDVCGEAIECYARKKGKDAANIIAGDIVQLADVNENVVDGVMPRRNSLIRPPIANIDQMLITLAPVPQVDFMLLDKLIINARAEGIATILCLNKRDISSPLLLDEINKQYGGIVDNIVEVSALNNDVAALSSLLEGKLTCFAGQSAVGKSSLINALTGQNRTVGTLSEKNLRGKNTTTKVDLIKLADNTYIADTPGFTMLDIHNIEYADLAKYYGEYVALADGCKYSSCTHTAEPSCAIKDAVEQGKLNKSRYERYCLMFYELKNKKVIY